jgi:hypothetical protein
MHDHQIRTPLDRLEDRCFGGVDRHDEPAYLVRPTHLKTVQGSRIVRMSIYGKVFPDILEEGF